MIVLKDLPAHGSAENYLYTLTQSCSEAINARASFHGPEQAHAAYLRGIDRILFRLTYSMPEHIKRSTIVTDTYRMLFASNPGSAEHVLRAVTLELDRIVRVLSELRESVQDQVNYWQNCGSLVLPDTNFYLSPTEANWLETANLAHALNTTEDHITLIVPIAVVDELDNLKRDKERRVQARWALRSIEKHAGSPGERGTLQQRGAPNQPDPGPLVDIAVVLDPPDHSPAIITDDEIVARGEAAQTVAGKPVHLASYDLGFQLRARALGLSAAVPNAPQDPG